jgi:hypothetical protein
MTIIVIAILTGLCFASLLYISNKSQHYGKALTTLLFILRSIAIGLLVLLFFLVVLRFATYPIVTTRQCLSELIIALAVPIVPRGTLRTIGKSSPHHH